MGRSWQSGHALLALVPAAPLLPAAMLTLLRVTALDAPGIGPPLQAWRSGTSEERILIVLLLTACEPIAFSAFHSVRAEFSSAL